MRSRFTAVARFGLDFNLFWGLVCGGIFLFGFFFPPGPLSCQNVLPVAAYGFCLTNSSSIWGGERQWRRQVDLPHNWQLFDCYKYPA